MRDEIRALAGCYAAELKRNIDQRVNDMERDDRSHVLIYQVPLQKPRNYGLD